MSRTLYIERSATGSRDDDWVRALDLEGVTRIVVGVGPGSFAGIRSALAFAQGYAIGSGCEVLGLSSACALVEEGDGRLAVVGDSRRGMYWVALFEGFELVQEVFQVAQNELINAVPSDYQVVTPDAARIDEVLREIFGKMYLGGRVPTSVGLQRFAERNPKILKTEPLPIYLNPAVRG